MRPIWMSTAYRVCAFLDAHPGEYDVFELNARAVPKIPKPTLQHTLRLLIQGDFIQRSGGRESGKVVRALYTSTGDAAPRYEAFKIREAASVDKTAEPLTAAVPIDRAFIITALAAHPLHQWRGVNNARTQATHQS